MTIRTAILGYGRSGSTMHAGGIANNPRFRMAAACDIDPARRAEAAARFGCPVYDDYRRMLAEQKPDLVCVVTRSDQHSAMACDCLAAGAHVLVTKPWALNEAEARRMIDTATRARRLLLPWLPARWGGDLRRLRELAAARAIGRIFLIRRTVSSFGTRNDWQTERRFGGGYLLNWGPHIVDTALLLAGSPVESVTGHLRQILNPGDAEDLFFALFATRNGPLVQAEYTIAQDELPSWFVQGDGGTIVVRGQNLAVRRCTPARPDNPTRYSTMKTDGERSEETIATSAYGDTGEVYAEIARAVAGEQPFAVTPDDALRLTRVLDAVRLSHERQETIRFAEQC